MLEDMSPPLPPASLLEDTKCGSEGTPKTRLGDEFLAELAAFSLTEEDAKDRSLSPLGKIIFIGDVHGNFAGIPEALQLILDERGCFLGNAVFMGDYIDRGPESYEVLKNVFRLQQANPKNIVALFGNHELLCSYPIDLFVTLVAASLSTEYPDKITDKNELQLLGYLDAILTDSSFRLHAKYTDLDKSYEDIASLKEALVIRQEGKTPEVGRVYDFSLEKIDYDLLKIIYDNLVRIGGFYENFISLLKRNLSLFVRGANCFASHTIFSVNKLNLSNLVYSLLFARPNNNDDIFFLPGCQYLFRGHDVAAAACSPIVITKDQKVILTVHSFTQVFTFNPQNPAMSGIHVMLPMCIVGDEKGVRLHILEETFSTQFIEQIKNISSLKPWFRGRELKIIYSEKITDAIKDFNNTECYVDQNEKFLKLKHKINFITWYMIIMLQKRFEVEAENKIMKNSVEILFGSDEQLKIYEASLGLHLYKPRALDIPPLSLRSFQIANDVKSFAFNSYVQEVSRQLLYREAASALLEEKRQSELLHVMQEDFKEATLVEIAEPDVNSSEREPLLPDDDKKTDGELVKSQSKRQCVCCGLIQLFNLFRSMVYTDAAAESPEPKTTPGAHSV